MLIEIIITAVIVITAILIFAKNIKKQSQGCCDCSSCHQKNKNCCCDKNKY